MNLSRWFPLDDLVAVNSAESLDSFLDKFEGSIEVQILKRAFQLAHPMVLEEDLQVHTNRKHIGGLQAEGK
jgi:hypothetical protein